MKIDKGRIINDFIEPNKRQYAIPVYQRNYEWSKEQCVKLFEDIVQAYKKDRTHFCGSVVYAPLKEEQNIHYYIIIDGQQRLTTIYLLLKSLIDLAENDTTRELIAETLFNRDKFDKFAIDKASKLKLKPIKSDDNQLRLLMENKYDDIEKNSGIWRNYELFCSLVQAQLDAGMYVKDIYKGVEKLICASILLEQEDNAQEMFERINSTGVPLSLADKIRNFVLMTDADQESLYENYWLTDGDRVLLTALRDKLMGDKNLASMARTSDPQIFVESIFPKAFGDAAMESYTESQDTYTSLFEDQNKYNAIMSALAEVIYREMRKKK